MSTMDDTSTSTATISGGSGRTARKQNYKKINMLQEFLLLNLPLRERQIFKLHLDGMKNHEISADLGLSEITVRNTLHNARKRIRSIWKTFMR
jgi:RNA polymerase sigma factor (sigma-70 family)